MGAFTLRKRVEWRDVDAAQHLNNAAYFNYLEDCALQTANSLGWTTARTLAAGIAMIVQNQEIEYQQPAVLDDELDITTWLYEVRRFSAKRYYRLVRVSDGAQIAQALAQWVAVDAETGKPTRVPQQQQADFVANIALEPVRRG